jgi:hypothetical protein
MESLQCLNVMENSSMLVMTVTTAAFFVPVVCYHCNSRDWPGLQREDTNELRDADIFREEQDVCLWVKV